ncbi:biopolymer transporter ExbD [Novosphingobium sp. ZN18A2]|uniref:ExbD/TolR family protein n=1 Tax=Novosphingobium sp. ZN18A2 TaxID=3079861 RepID=UPI0030CFD2CF
MNLAGSGGGRRGRRGRGAGGPMSEINVTPLVDVMLVLLIIFMVTAPLLTAAVPIDLPDSKAKPLEQQQDQVTISLDASGKVYLDDEELAPGVLGDRIAALATGGKPPLVTLRADRALDYGRVMAVMGELNAAGITSISLVTSGSSPAQ